jgi:hypothetical protein
MNPKYLCQLLTVRGVAEAVAEARGFTTPVVGRESPGRDDWQGGDVKRCNSRGGRYAESNDRQSDRICLGVRDSLCDLTGAMPALSVGMPGRRT